MSENMILLTILGIAILGTLGLSQDALADSANLLVNPTNVYVTLAYGDSVSPSTALTIDPFDPIFTGELISVSVSGDGCDGLQFTYDGQSLPTSIHVGTSSTITGELGFSHDGIGEMTNLLCLVVYDSPLFTAATTRVNVTLEPITPPLTVKEQIDNLTTQVNDFLDGKDAKKLTKKLDKVNKALDKDKINKACKIMDKFIKKVDKFNAKDKLDQAEADLLKETVQSIRIDIGCS